MTTYNLNNNEFIQIENLQEGTNDIIVKAGYKVYHLRINKGDRTYVIMYNEKGHTQNYFVTTRKKLIIDKALILRFNEISEAYKSYNRFADILGE